MSSPEIAVALRVISAAATAVPATQPSETTADLASASTRPEASDPIAAYTLAKAYASGNGVVRDAARAKVAVYLWNTTSQLCGRGALLTNGNPKGKRP